MRIIEDMPDIPIALKVIEVSQEKKYCRHCKKVVTASSALAIGGYGYSEQEILRFSPSISQGAKMYSLNLMFLDLLFNACCKFVGLIFLDYGDFQGFTVTAKECFLQELIHSSIGL